MPTKSTPNQRRAMIKARRIDPQTYRIGEFVAFQNDKLYWKMGKPVFEDDPMGGFVEGSTTLHSTLRSAVAVVRSRARKARKIEFWRHPRQSSL